jgi:hypothetical protein
VSTFRVIPSIEIAPSRALITRGDAADACLLGGLIVAAFATRLAAEPVSAGLLQLMLTLATAMLLGRSIRVFSGNDRAIPAILATIALLNFGPIASDLSWLHCVSTCSLLLATALMLAAFGSAQRSLGYLSGFVLAFAIASDQSNAILIAALALTCLSVPRSAELTHRLNTLGRMMTCTLLTLALIRLPAFIFDWRDSLSPLQLPAEHVMTIVAGIAWPVAIAILLGRHRRTDQIVEPTRHHNTRLHWWRHISTDDRSTALPRVLAISWLVMLVLVGLLMPGRSVSASSFAGPAILLFVFAPLTHTRIASVIALVPLAVATLAMEWL